MARGVGRRDPREVLDERPHLRCAERAVDADDKGLGVLHGEPECFDRLAGEVAARAVDRGEGDPERKLGRSRAGRDESCLRVQRVEDGLDQEEVHAAVSQRPDLFLIRLANLVERDRPVRRIVDSGRE